MGWSTACWHGILKNLIQLTALCNSCIQALSYIKVFWSSVNLFLESPSTRGFSAILPCLAYSWHEFHEEPHLVLTFLLEVVIDLAWDWSHPVKIWSISIRWESIIPVNSWILLLSDSAWSSCLWISDLNSARICSFCLSKDSLVFPGRDLIIVFETNLNLFRARVFPYLYGWKRTELATNFLHKSDKFVSGSLVLLAPEWTVVKESAFSDKLIVEFHLARARWFSVYIDGFILEDHCISLWVVGVVRAGWAHNLW